MHLFRHIKYQVVIATVILNIYKYVYLPIKIFTRMKRKQT